MGAVLVALMLFLLSRHREGLAIHLLHLFRRIPVLRRIAARLEPRAAAFHEIDTHVTAIFRALRVANRAEAVRTARTAALI